MLFWCYSQKETNFITNGSQKNLAIQNGIMSDTKNKLIHKIYFPYLQSQDKRYRVIFSYFCKLSKWLPLHFSPDHRRNQHSQPVSFSVFVTSSRLTARRISLYLKIPWSWGERRKCLFFIIGIKTWGSFLHKSIKTCKSWWETSLCRLQEMQEVIRWQWSASSSKKKKKK